MKKLILIATLIASPVYADPATSDKKTVGDFIKSGGFSQLCKDLGWTMGWLGDTGVGCFSEIYAQRNGYVYDEKTSTWLASK